jgi:putative membrane protein
MMRLPLAVLHLLALGIGMGAVYGRGRALALVGRAPDALRRATTADAWWGVAALLWVSTGLWRALAGTEKAAGYYWSNHVFYAKMGMFVAVGLLEVWPMLTLMRWRRGLGADGGATLVAGDASLAQTARRVARISDVQLLLLVGIVVAAVMMARGYGARG